MSKEITTEILDILLEYKSSDIISLMQETVKLMDDDKLEGFRAKLKNYWVWEGSFSGESLLDFMEDEIDRRQKQNVFLASSPNTTITGNGYAASSNIDPSGWGTITYNVNPAMGVGNEVFCEYDEYSNQFKFGDKAMAAILKNVREGIAGGYLSDNPGPNSSTEAMSLCFDVGQQIANAILGNGSCGIKGDLNCGNLDQELIIALERIKAIRPDLFT